MGAGTHGTWQMFYEPSLKTSFEIGISQNSWDGGREICKTAIVRTKIPPQLFHSVSGFQNASYLLFLDPQACNVIESYSGFIGQNMAHRAPLMY